jgi:hypothetical protein
MWLFTDLADWWDEKKQESSKYLHEFVDEHDSWWAIAIAGSVQTAMNLGGGFVDVLRLGDGVRQGTWRGVLQDGLRLLSLAGPIAKVGRGVSRVLVPNPGGKICAWVSATQALRQTGVQHFATIEDIALAAGKVPGGATMMELEQILTAAGADVRVLSTPATMAAVNELVRANPQGVVMFGIRWVSSKGATVRHALYAFRNVLGKVKIVDRSGKVVESLSELEGVYKGISAATPEAATFVKNAQIVQLINGTSAAAVEVRAVMLANEETADAKFAQYRMLRGAGYSASTAAHPHKTAAAKPYGVPSSAGSINPSVTASSAAKPSATKPSAAKPSATGSSAAKPGGPVLQCHTVKAGETWETILRPSYESSSYSSPLSFAEYVSAQRATNRLMGDVPETGPLQPGMNVCIY